MENSSIWSIVDGDQLFNFTMCQAVTVMIEIYVKAMDVLF